MSCFLSGIATGEASGQDLTVPVWPDGPPDSNGITEPESVGGRLECAWNVTEPTLTAYLPDPERSTGTAVLIMPGGGYWQVCTRHEGVDVAHRLNRDGIAAFVLKYRLPNGHEEIPLEDAQQALKIIRSRSEEWRVARDRVGVLGFSAGGHLASTVATHFGTDIAAGAGAIEGQSVRPDFQVLVYAGITLMEPIGHQELRRSLLGDDPSERLIARFSNELRVSAETPPAFVVHSIDDEIAVFEHSLRFVEALRTHDVPVEFHAFEKGGHGFGLGPEGSPVATWSDLLVRWLVGSGFLPERE